MAAPCHAASWQFLDDEAEPNTDLSFTLKTAKTGSLTVVFDYTDDKNHYALDFAPKSLSLRSVINGSPHRLTGAAIEWRPVNQVIVLRRPWLMQVIVNREVMLTAYDATFIGGKIGSAGTGGWSWDDTRVQPIEELYYTDDFTRAPGQDSDWKSYNGQWNLTSSSDAINDRNVEMSANPFAFQVSTAGGEAMTQVGRWFWNNYEAQVSVRPAGQGTVGIAVLVQDAKNYLAFLWKAPESNAARQLVRVVDGKATVVASAPGAYLPRQWYRLSMRTSPGYIETFIDGALIFKTRNDWFGQGSIGLLARNINTATFDDVRVQSYDFYRQDFSGPTGGAWNPVSGDWRLQNGQLVSTAAANNTGAARLFMAGRDDWKGYQFTASARAAQNGACGLVAAYHSPQDYVLFRWADPRSGVPFKGRQQLVRYQSGKSTVVSDEAATVLAAADKDGFVRVRLRLAAGALTVYANDEAVAQLGDETLTSGKVGLWALSNGTAAFRDVVMFFPPEPVAPKVPPKMEDDALMVGWASPSGEWPPSYGDKGAEFWNTGDFFGDAAVEYQWSPLNATGKLEFALRAKRGDFYSGYILRCEGELSEDKKPMLHATLLRNSTTLKEARISLKELPGAEATQPDKPAIEKVALRVDMEGRAISLSVGDVPQLTYIVPDPATAPRGSNIGAHASFTLKAKDLKAISSHRDDYTFTEAPTDWYSPQGNWNIISRWPCYSDWSFFGGKGTAPMLWGKHLYSGDTVVEMYAHNQMDLPKEIAYSRPGNLNITIAGDGKSPASGYSFIVAGWDNTRTRIYRGTQMVAENATPKAWFSKPINHNYTFHKRWYYIRAEAREAEDNGRKGVRLRLLLDDELLAEYFDLQPLDAFNKGGRVCFWTVDGSLMLARAKIEAETMGARSLPVGLIDSVVSPASGTSGEGNDLIPVSMTDDGQPTAVVERSDGGREGSSWIVRNPACGGSFGVQLQKPDAGRSTWQVGPSSHIEMDVQLPPEVKIDLYVTIDGTRHLIQLTDTQRPDARARLLGDTRPLSTVSTAGIKWQHVNFALGEALQKLYPSAKSWTIDEINLGVLHGDDYRLVGFDGNPLGAAYRLRGVRIG